MSAGWGRAIRSAVLIFVLMAGLGQLLAILAVSGQASDIETAKAGGLVFFAFHHAGIRAELPTLDPEGVAASVGAPEGSLPPVDVSITLGFPILLATLLIVLLCFRAGRGVAESGGGSWAARVGHGAKVALPYAVLSLLFALAIKMDVRTPFTLAGFPPGPVGLRPSYVEAVLWPLVLAGLAGGLGGLSAAGPELWDTWRGRLAGAAVAGGLRMAGLGLLFSFAALLGLAAASPGLAGEYFGAALDAGLRGGAAVIVFTALLVPNMALWVLVPAMGGAIGASGGGTGFTLLSYGSFPVEVDPSAFGQTGLPSFAETGGLPVQLEGAAPVYFLFLLIPIAATILAGMRAARQIGAESARAGADVGATAGAVFALTLLFLSILSGIWLSFETDFQGFSQTQRVTLGPGLLLGGVLGLLWGGLGGALGGALEGRRASSRRGPDDRARVAGRPVYGPAGGGGGGGGGVIGGGVEGPAGTS